MRCHRSSRRRRHGSRALLLTLTLSASLLAATTPIPAQAARILVLGDSLSAAYGMHSHQGWVHLLANKLAGSHEVFNASISGETSAGAQRRLPELLRRFEPDIVIVELGANDGLRGYPLNLIRRNLSEIMRLCRQAGAQPIVTEMKIPPNYGARYSESFTRLFAQLAKRFAAPLIPFFLEDFATRPEMMQADGLHPLPITQPLIRDQVMAVLRPLLVPTAAKTKAKDTAL